MGVAEDFVGMTVCILFFTLLFSVVIVTFSAPMVGLAYVLGAEIYVTDWLIGCIGLGIFFAAPVATIAYAESK